MLETDIYYSYLPLAHVFERFMMTCCIAYRMQYGFYQGDVLKMTNDLATLRPTFMICVPRVCTKFYDSIQHIIRSMDDATRGELEAAAQIKIKNLEERAEAVHEEYDPKFFHKFKNILGGRVRIMITGSAPIAKEVLNFLKIAFCVRIHEGYGQTESVAPASITWAVDPESGHVGAPMPSLDIKLVDVPEMNYTSEDRDHQGRPAPRGEVCYRGYNCFKGYYRQPDITQ